MNVQILTIPIPNDKLNMCLHIDTCRKPMYLKFDQHDTSKSTTQFPQKLSQTKDKNYGISGVLLAIFAIISGQGILIIPFYWCKTTKMMAKELFFQVKSG